MATDLRYELVQAPVKSSRPYEETMMRFFGLYLFEEVMKPTGEPYEQRKVVATVNLAVLGLEASALYITLFEIPRWNTTASFWDKEHMMPKSILLFPDRGTPGGTRSVILKFVEREGPHFFYEILNEKNEVVRRLDVEIQ